MDNATYAGVNRIETVINDKRVNLIDSFFKPQTIASVEDIDTPGVFGGINIFDPTQYTANGISTPTDNTSKLETYYKNLIGTTIDTSKNPLVLNSYTTAGRPSGVTGLLIFDTTLDKVLIFNGTSWVDQAGRIS